MNAGAQTEFCQGRAPPPGHGAAPAGAACAARAASRRAPDDLPCGRNSRADTQKVLSFEALCLTDRA